MKKGKEQEEEDNSLPLNTKLERSVKGKNKKALAPQHISRVKGCVLGHRSVKLRQAGKILTSPGQRSVQDGTTRFSQTKNEKVREWGTDTMVRLKMKRANPNPHTNL